MFRGTIVGSSDFFTKTYIVQESNDLDRLIALYFIESKNAFSYCISVALSRLRTAAVPSRGRSILICFLIYLISFAFYAVGFFLLNNFVKNIV